MGVEEVLTLYRERTAIGRSTVRIAAYVLVTVLEKRRPSTHGILSGKLNNAPPIPKDRRPRESLMPRKKGKHRKRVSKHIPAKGRLRNMADSMYSLAVRRDWGGKCAECGISPGEAHHVFPRQHEATRYDRANGIVLCAWHHKFDPEISPHQNALGWLGWLSGNYPEVHQWYADIFASNGHKAFAGVTNATYYCGVIRELKQHVEPKDYERILGVKFSKWLTENA